MAKETVQPMAVYNSQIFQGIAPPRFIFEWRNIIKQGYSCNKRLHTISHPDSGYDFRFAVLSADIFDRIDACFGSSTDTASSLNPIISKINSRPSLGLTE